MTLSVVRTNPALGLYRRLGFTEAGGDEVYLEMKRGPDPSVEDRLVAGPALLGLTGHEEGLELAELLVLEAGGGPA